MLDVNPDFALQSRLSFGRGARYAWALTIGALFVAFDGPTFRVAPALAFTRAGAFLLLAALPYGAINVRALDSDGRLDARRLTGRSPVALALALLGGSAWALLLAAVVLLLVGLRAGSALPAFTLAALLAMGATMALVMLLLPKSTQLDSWLLLVMLAVGAIGTVHVMGADRGVALGVLIVSAVVCPWALPLALRRMRSAPPPVAGPPRSWLRRLIHLDRTRRPELARGLMSVGPSAGAAGVVAIAGSVAIAWMAAQWAPETRDLFEVLVVYGSLLLAGYDTAGRILYEHDTGGLDRIRLSGQSPARVVIDAAAAVSMPFIAVSLVCAATLALTDPVNAWDILSHWPLVAVILIFGPVTGALRGRRPVLYMGASILVAAMVARSRVPWMPGVLAMTTAVAMAIGSLERAGRRPDGLLKAVAGAAALAAIIVSLFTIEYGGLLIAGLIALSAGLLFPDGTRVPGRTILTCAVAAAVAAGIVEYYWIRGDLALHVRVYHGRSVAFYYPAWREQGGIALYAIVTGLYAALGLIFGCSALNQFGARGPISFAVRTMPTAAALLLFEIVSTMRASVVNDAFMERYRYNGLAVLELILLAAFGAAVAGLVWREIRERRRLS